MGLIRFWWRYVVMVFMRLFMLSIVKLLGVGVVLLRVI